MYLTGDLTRYRADGRIEHLGRLDHQIKIRGFRVEPGEIEAALTAAPDIAAAVVVARGYGLAETRLVAYVVPAGAPPGPADLRSRLGATLLPAYMVPSVFVNLDALPLTANGKIDRRGLPEPKASLRRGRSLALRPPRHAVEERMAAYLGAHSRRRRRRRPRRLLRARGPLAAGPAPVGSRWSEEFGAEIPLGFFLEERHD
jgi:hypothetical protein